MSFVIRRSSLVVRSSPFAFSTNHRPPFVVHSSPLPFAIHHLPSAIRHSPFTILPSNVCRLQQSGHPTFAASSFRSFKHPLMSQPSLHHPILFTFVCYVIPILLPLFATSSVSIYLYSFESQSETVLCPSAPEYKLPLFDDP